MVVCQGAEMMSCQAILAKYVVASRIFLSLGQSFEVVGSKGVLEVEVAPL